MRLILGNIAFTLQTSQPSSWDVQHVDFRSSIIFPHLSLLSSEQLRKRRGSRVRARVVALNNVDLEVEDDDFLALMGPSGSGKSTLLYTIGSLLTPTEGEVTIDGQSIYKMRSRQRVKFRRENIGFIFQTIELIPYLTALENVMLPLYLSGVAMAKHRDLAEEALDKVGLADRALHKRAELSGGFNMHIDEGKYLVCDVCNALWDFETFEGVSGAVRNTLLRCFQ